MIADRGYPKRNEPVAQGGPLSQAPETNASYQWENLDILALAIDGPRIVLAARFSLQRRPAG